MSDEQTTKTTPLDRLLELIVAKIESRAREMEVWSAIGLRVPRAIVEGSHPGGVVLLKRLFEAYQTVHPYPNDADLLPLWRAELERVTGRRWLDVSEIQTTEESDPEGYGFDATFWVSTDNAVEALRALMQGLDGLVLDERIAVEEVRMSPQTWDEVGEASAEIGGPASFVSPWIEKGYTDSLPRASAPAAVDMPEGQARSVVDGRDDLLDDAPVDDPFSEE